MQTPQEALQEIQKISATAFLTGSFRFKRNYSSSDIDIAVIITDKVNISEDLRLRNIAIIDSKYNGGFKYQKTLNDRYVNIIPLHPVEFVCWYKAAKMIDVITSDIKQMNRQEFHAFHQMILATIKLALSKKKIYSKNYTNYIDGSVSGDDNTDDFSILHRVIKEVKNEHRKNQRDSTRDSLFR